MNEISQLDFDEVKKNALNLFLKNKIIFSPAFWKIKITPEWFNHIEWKSKNHKRSTKESYIRYLCFLHIKYILENSKLYQEFREEFQIFDLRRNSKIFKEKKIVCLYGFVAVVNNNKNRVKIVIRKVDWWDNYEFVSVIPVWKSTWYSGELFFDEDLRFLK